MPAKRKAAGARPMIIDSEDERRAVLVDSDSDEHPKVRLAICNDSDPAAEEAQARCRAQSEGQEGAPVRST